MKLRTLSVVCLLGACLGTVGMMAHAVVGWRAVSGGLAEVEQLSTLRQRTARLNVAADYVHLVEYDPYVLRAISADAREISAELAALDDPDARIASKHLTEIATMSDDVVEVLDGSIAGARGRSIARQFRIHQAGVADTLEMMLSARQREIRETLTGNVVSFGLGSMVFAGLCLFAFAVIQRRLGRPLIAFRRAFEELGAGNLDTRIPLEGDDELARLARQFNATVERLREATEERDGAFAALEHERAMLARTEGISRIGSWEWDVAADEVTWSEELCRILGVEPTAEPRSFAEHASLFVPEDFARLEAAVERALEDGESHEVGLRAVRPDGEIRHCLTRGEVETDEQGEVVRMFGSLQDLTERRRTQEETEGLRARLAQASRLEAIGRLAGGVAHDFNNMLTVIRGHAELALAEADPGDPLRADLEEIHYAADRSEDLTGQLLAFAREQSIAPEVLDLNGVVEGMLPLLRRLIGEDVELLWLPAPDLWRVQLDASQVGQIATNLCVNGMDAIDGTGTVAIETRNVTIDDDASPLDLVGSSTDLRSSDVRRVVPAPGSYVLLSVSDDGRGMEDEVLDHVFDPFFTTKADGHGTGLGLATVYGIVKQNEGFINAYSELGEGSTFRIYLPRHVGEVDVAAADPAAEADAEVPRGGGERILLVEDDPAILALCERMLGREGYEVIATTDAAEAVAMAEGTERFDLLVTDVVMPQMGGRELSARVADLHPGIGILFISGYTADVVARKGIPDVDGVLVEKPFSARELARKVREALRSGPGRRSGEARGQVGSS